MKSNRVGWKESIPENWSSKRKRKTVEVEQK